VAAQAERGFLWTPVAFGAGSAVYFSLKTEPDWTLASAPALLILVCALAIGRWTVNRALHLSAVLLVMAAMGFADAKLVTQWAAAPVAPANLGVVRVEGWVVDVASPSQGRTRLLIAPTFIAGLAPAATPARVRVTLKTGAAITPGHGVTLRAILDPPPGPASPGGYDFARDAWFDRVGAVGLALTPPEEIDPPAASLSLRIEMTLNQWRWRLARRLAEDLQAMGQARGAGLVAAVTTSHQDWLDPADTDDLRNSGLAHMLAIAGLHTAAVTGFVFAAIPSWSRRGPGWRYGFRARSLRRSAVWSLSPSIWPCPAPIRRRDGRRLRRLWPFWLYSWIGAPSACIPWRWPPWSSWRCSRWPSSSPDSRCRFAPPPPWSPWRSFGRAATA